MLTVAIDQRIAAYQRAGIARFALELGDALRQIPDVEVVPLRHARDRDAPSECLLLRTPPHHRLEEWLLGAELLARRTGADIYHATDFVAPRLPHIPVVASVHDLAFLRWPEHVDRDGLAYYRRIFKRRNATSRWIVPSQWTKRDLCELVDVEPDRVAIVPYGVARFVGSEPPLPRQSRRAFVLAVGTIEPRKRYDLLLDAFEVSRKSHSLCVVGRRGWNTDELQHRLANSPGVTWFPGASDEDLRLLLREATALAIPSIAEGFGFAALEAMACGTPVISSGHGALAELTAGCALQPDGDDVAGWSSAIQRVIEDGPLWDRLSAGGSRRAREFTWERAARMTAEVYRDVLGTNAS